MFLLFYVCLGLLVIVGFMILKPLQFFVYTRQAIKKYNENLNNDMYDGTWYDPGMQYYYAPTMEKVEILHLFGRRVCKPIHQLSGNVVVYDEIGDRLRRKYAREREYQLKHLSPGQRVVFYSGCTPDWTNLLFQDPTSSNGLDMQKVASIITSKNKELLKGNIYTDIQTNTLLWVRPVNVYYTNRNGRYCSEKINVFIDSNCKLRGICDYEEERINNIAGSRPELKKAVDDFLNEKKFQLVYFEKDTSGYRQVGTTLEYNDRKRTRWE